MLNDSNDSDDYYVICGIDPGLVIGISFIFINIKTFKIEKYKTIPVNCHKLKLSNSTIDNKTERLAKLEKLKEILVYEFSYNRPCTICIESPFYSSRTPSAFGSIKEITSVVKEAVDQYDNTIYLLSIDPPTVKKAVNAKGNHDKEHVKDKVILLYKDIENLDGKNIESLDEHEIDSLAICYGLYDYIFYNRKDDNE